MGFIKDLFYEQLRCTTCDKSIKKGKGHTVSGTIATKMVRESYENRIAKFRASGYTNLASSVGLRMTMDLNRGEYFICDKCFSEYEQAKLDNPSAAREDEIRQSRCKYLFDAGNYGGIQYWCEQSNSPGLLGQGSRIPLSDGNHIRHYCLGNFAQCPLYTKRH